MKRKGFTLIELLVVIAIIGMLLAILAPAMQNAKKLAAGSTCLANLRGLALSFYLYAENNDGKVARSGVTNRPNDELRWVDRPINNSGVQTNHNSTVEEKLNGLMNGLLFPYTETVKVYHCVGDKRFRDDIVGGGKGGYRSYSMPDSIGGTGGWTVTSDITGAQTRINRIENYSQFINPSGKYVFIEENYTHGSGTSAINPPDVGYNTNNWSFWHGDTYEAWWDPLAPWHNDKTNLGYADGHAQKLVWRDERTIWFSKDRFDPRLGTDKHSCATQLNNVDQQYMSRAFPAGK